MKRAAISSKDLRRELERLQEEYRGKTDDELFVLWFLRAFVTEDDAAAAHALTGGPGDKNLDAILVDDDRRNVFIVQGKYRQKVDAKAEKWNDVLEFAAIADRLTGSASGYRDFAEGLPAAMQLRVAHARERVTKRGYRLHLYYVTTGRCSEALKDEASRLVRRTDPEPSFQIIGGRQVLLLLSDYLDGIAPPVPSLDLEIQSDGGRSDAVMRRYDPARKIESWIFSIADTTARELFEHAGVRLFARNVRGWLGKTEINESMEETLRSEPEYFWYYNNGITVVCDDAERKSRSGRDILRVTNPQVINGQQTTRTLAAGAGPRAQANVLVRVIRVQRSAGDQTRFDSLVSRIVAATNWQNAIDAADLMSNDRRQVEIERGLRPLGFWYIRKRQVKSEVRRLAGSQDYYLIRKEQLAQAVAACELDPQVVRLGKKGLFEEAFYTKVFPNADPLFYLPRFFLFQAVGAAAKGFPEQAYAKWVAMHFLWSRVAPVINGRLRREALIADWWVSGPAWTALVRSSSCVLRAALQMYRKQRGKGAKAIDVSTYFKRAGLHKGLERFWPSRGNNNRKALAKAWARFEAAIGENVA